MNERLGPSKLLADDFDPSLVRKRFIRTYDKGLVLALVSQLDRLCYALYNVCNALSLLDPEL